jgi:hypothetical protein
MGLAAVERIMQRNNAAPGERITCQRATLPGQLVMRGSHRELLPVLTVH